MQEMAQEEKPRVPLLVVFTLLYRKNDSLENRGLRGKMRTGKMQMQVLHRERSRLLSAQIHISATGFFYF